MNKPRSPVKFLLVHDDLEENLLVLEALLRREDLDLLKAGSGREALELMLEHDFALALIDVQMPEMDGFELAELMRGSERTRHVPIIFKITRQECKSVTESSRATTQGPWISCSSRWSHRSCATRPRPFSASPPANKT